VIPDPPIPPDGACVVCRSERPPIAVAYADPFCKTECARAWHNPRAVRARGWHFARVLGGAPR